MCISRQRNVTVFKAKIDSPEVGVKITIKNLREESSTFEQNILNVFGYDWVFNEIND